MNEPSVLVGTIIAVYVVITAAVSVAFRRFNRNTNDYFRAGGVAPWWLVGVSIFMQSFSAVTFTGVAAQAFAVGVSAGWVLWCNAFVFLLHAAFLAARFRRTRAQTQADVIRERFGLRFEQFFVYLSAATTPCFLAINLLGAATFVSAMFGYPLINMIVAIGFAATVSSVLGGRWGCMANGYLQMTIVLSVSAAVACLCWSEVGGFVGAFDRVATAGNLDFPRPLRPVAEAQAIPGVVAAGAFTWTWLAALLLHSTIMSTSLATACRYHAARDERSGRKAAALACALLLVGSLAWGLPAFTSRALYEEEVRATVGLRSPEDSAYVVAALHVLPPAVSGLLAIAMLAATTSALDGAQSFVAGNLANNALPTLLARFRLPLPVGNWRLAIAMGANTIVGFTVAALATFVTLVDSASGMFDLMLELMGSISVPMHIPLAMGLLWRRAGAHAAWVSLGVGFAASAAFLALSVADVYHATWQMKVFAIAASGAVGFAFALVGRRGEDQEERTRVQSFFDRLDRPIAKSAGSIGADARGQQKAIFWFGQLIAGLIAILGVSAADADRAVIFSIAASVAVMTGLVYPRSKTHSATASRDDRSV